MFKKFTRRDNVSGSNLVKSSVARNIRKAILATYPDLSTEIDFFLPKKTPTYVTKTDNYCELVICNEEALFFKIRKGVYIPTLRTLHRYPNLLPHVQVDRGAIPYVMVKGANVMSPGLTSAGGSLPDDLKEGTIVAIHAEDKTHACAIGIMKMDSNVVKSTNKGTALDNLHYLGDGLWQGWTGAEQQVDDEDDY